jgi:hypothetical protein
MFARTRTDDRSARRWPRAAVWGGAIASTAMNLSANWHATTVRGVTTFVAPTANGLHLPEVTKLVVSAAFPLLLIFAVESAARTSLRFRFGDLGSYAMPLGALTVFAFSVGEVTRLLLGMGMPPHLAALFALAPDILITAGTVVLMRERAVLRQTVATPSAPIVDHSVWDVDIDDPALPVPTTYLKAVPVVAAKEPPVPVEQEDVPASREQTADVPPPKPRTKTSAASHPTRPARTVVAMSTAEDDAPLIADITRYRDANGGSWPTAHHCKKNFATSHRRASRVLAAMRSETSLVEVAG